MLRNPFCFLVQVFGTLAAVWPVHGICASDGFHGHNLGDSVIGVSADGDVCGINDNTVPFDWVSALAPSAVTSHHMGLPSALKRVAPQDSFSGLGSSASETMLRNPFCFLVQVHNPSARSVGFAWVKLRKEGSDKVKRRQRRQTLHCCSQDQLCPPTPPAPALWPTKIPDAAYIYELLYFDRTGVPWEQLTNLGAGLSSTALEGRRAGEGAFGLPSSLVAEPPPLYIVPVHGGRGALSFVSLLLRVCISGRFPVIVHIAPRVGPDGCETQARNARAFGGGPSKARGACNDTRSGEGAVGTPRGTFVERHSPPEAWQAREGGGTGSNFRSRGVSHIIEPLA
ncbi:hypothetical protein HPB50_017312 [Hyalomma asiaticum]|uniref:Uncharacterized protein n=1 Tax=Hyalomma asiaticum TaxID=266040 RepID=A0ACB7TLG4_HYAAI|nr:hypothetical protein HPB50_017312 [Hyalomma asiaticum]